MQVLVVVAMQVLVVVAMQVLVVVAMQGLAAVGREPLLASYYLSPDQSQMLYDYSKNYRVRLHIRLALVSRDRHPPMDQRGLLLLLRVVPIHHYPIFLYILDL